MAWTIDFRPSAIEDLRKLDQPIARRIRDFLRKRVMASDNPRQLGKPLRGEKAGMWRFRVGEHRIICLLENETRTVLVLEVGHCREVYR